MNQNIFNSFIWKTKLAYDKKLDLIKNIEHNYKKNPDTTPSEWFCNVYTSFNDSNDKLISQDLIKKILDKVDEFIDSNSSVQLKGNYHLNDIWYNVYDYGQFQEMHDHGDNLLSGCYYLKYNKDIHYPTIFFNPNYDIDFSSIMDNPNFVFTPDIEEEDLIIFPSFLKHMTKGLISPLKKETRITISFNIRNDMLGKPNSVALKNKTFYYG